jgi:Phosphoenolpyruvate carboxykinase
MPWQISTDKPQVANPSVSALYEDALVYETGSAMTSTGALTAYSGAKTGRSPLDKRIVKEEGSENDVWWGPVNKPMSPDVCQATPSHAPSSKRSRASSSPFVISWPNLVFPAAPHSEFCSASSPLHVPLLIVQSLLPRLGANITSC